MATTPPTSEDNASYHQEKAKAAGVKVCKDCIADFAITSVRPAPHPGPRCKTHWLRRRKETRAKAHASHVQKTYGLGEHDYGKLYEAQGGVCAICQRATGATRKLSVDHDHSCCSGGVSCGYCVRGLLCRPCNDMLGHARDSWEFFARAIRYLNGKRAAETVLGKVRTS